MRKKEQILSIKLLLLIADSIIITLTFIISYWLRFNIKIIPLKFGIPPFSEYLKIIPIAIVVWIFLMSKFKLYDLHEIKQQINVFFNIVKTVSLGIIILTASSFFYREFEYSRVVVVLLWSTSIITLTSFRISISSVLKHLYRKGYGISNVLIIGAGKIGKMVENKLSGKIEYGYHIIGFLDDKKKADKHILGTTDELEEVIKKYDINEIIMALPFREREKIMDLTMLAETLYVKTHIVPDFFEFIIKKIDISNFNEIPLFALKEPPLSGWNVFLKTAFDMLFSIVLIILLLPVFILIILLIKISSSGPVFYLQERIGRDGKKFIMYKFRTMKQNAEKETGPIWANENDKRRTIVGKILRRFSLDELPQFFNVLKGDMSIVGPRPERPVFVKKFQANIEEYFARHKVKSGITGWAQVNGLRGNTSIEERTKYDLYYIENWSLLFDIRIILMTVFQAIFGKNAY